MTLAPALDEYLATLRAEVELALTRLIDAAAAPPVIAAPVRYALLGRGKRLRPCLTLAIADAVTAITSSGLDRRSALPAACSVEMIHMYSLVHDDLPAMDDDALRHGRPTTHVVYGDGLAILAGDGLLTEAFAVMAAWPSPAAPAGAAAPRAENRLRAAGRLADAAGVNGMVGGQAIDLALAGQMSGHVSGSNAAAIEDMHARKTAALFRAAAAVGAIIVGGTDTHVAAADRFAADFGLAFQIIDDVLDVEGSSVTLGKTAGKDAAAGKPTYPALYGVSESRRRAAECVERAKHALTQVGIGGYLLELADSSLRRQK